MNKRKGLVYAILSFLLVGCSQTQTVTKENGYAVSSYITKDIIKHSEEGNLALIDTVEFTPETMNKYASDIAIIKVISLEKADMDFATFVPCTYGKMLINTTLHGKVSEGEVVSYVKPGGVISVADYDAADYKEAVEKHDRMRSENGITIDKEHTYYDIVLGDDIKIEEGKTYLAYLTYHEEKQVYEIMGLGNGLREVNVAQAKERVNKETYDLKELKIKNNHRQDYESLTDYVKKNIKP